MKGLVILVLLLICLIPDFGNQFRGNSLEHPVMNLHRQLRQGNWIGRNYQGSCVVASMVSLLRWQGHPATAARLKARYSGGQYYEGWKAILDAEGITYAATRGRKDVSFLEKAIATRRGCMVTVMGEAHMICLVDLTATKACLLDNNFPDQFIWMDRDKFLTEWFEANSWALTPVYSPASPKVPL